MQLVMSACIDGSVTAARIAESSSVSVVRRCCPSTTVASDTATDLIRTMLPKKYGAASVSCSGADARAPSKIVKQLLSLLCTPGVWTLVAGDREDVLIAENVGELLFFGCKGLHGGFRRRGSVSFG